MEFRDYDAATGTFTNAVRECALVTGETRTLGSGWYAVQGEVTIPEGVNLTVNGDAHLILCDEATLRILNPGGYAAAIRVSGTNSLAFYGQTEGSGLLIAYGGDFTACIGGANGDKGGAVTINGGKMTVTGGHHGAGIGGGSSCSDFTVTINGGTVTANGSKRGAGIGGGDANTGGVVTINGGIVNASGGIGAAGIGGGLNGAGGTVTINGGQVTATGDAKGAGIGSGEECNGGTVTINGGQVTATGGGGAAGIGGGQCGTDFMVTISGGVVNAHGGSGAASIGSGHEGAGGTVMISGGQVTATGTVTSADIGSGYDATTPCIIAISGGIFWKEPENDWLATHCLKVENPDAATKTAYPWKVIPPCVVTVGANLNMGVVWTSGDGTKMNEVRGASFTVPHGTENVKVIFTADDGYEIVSETNEVSLGTVTENITFGEESGFTVPEVAITDPCLIAFQQGIWNMSVAWTRGDGSVTNVVAGNIKATYVPRGSENVRIICAANPGYELVGESVIDIGTVTENVTFGQGNDFRLPIAYDSAVNVVYLDWDEEHGRMTNAVATTDFKRWTAVTEATRVLKGCMVVTNDVIIPIADVSGAAVLVLCNDATLTVTGGVEEAGILVPSDTSLTITVRKGSSGRVVARGSTNCAGIGSKFKQGTGSVLGAVRIVAGTVTATGGSDAAGIGNGFYGKGGSVKIFGGAVTAIGGMGGASDIGDGTDPYLPCEVSISGGVFAREPQEEWLAAGYEVVENPDAATKDAYPWAIAGSRYWVSPDVPLGPFDTAEKATNAMATAVFAPSEEVAEELTIQARARYEGWFGLNVAERGASEWYVETVLTDEAKEYLAETAANATRQIPVAEIAALDKNARTNVTVMGCEPGFYYTLYGGPELAALPTSGTKYWSEMCGEKGEFAIPVVAKPSEAAGFFAIGVDAMRPDNAGVLVFGIDGKLFSGEVDFGEADASSVNVWPDNVKPGLIYGLGRSESPTGPFVVEDGWVQADANGALPHAVRAPKVGPRSFYKIIVR